jgi:hypothetical protein
MLLRGDLQFIEQEVSSREGGRREGSHTISYRGEGLHNVCRRMKSRGFSEEKAMSRGVLKSFVM